MTFGTVLFSLLAQGTTIQFLLKRLGLIERPQHRVAREMRLGQLFAARAGLRQLERLHREGLLTDEIWTGLRDSYSQDQKLLVKEMNQLFLEYAELEREMLLQARREALQAERVAMSDVLRRGLLSDHVYEELTADVDRRLEAVNMILGAIQDGRVAQEGD